VIESFHGTFLDGCLKQHWFIFVAEGAPSHWTLVLTTTILAALNRIPPAFLPWSCISHTQKTKRSPA
jgi:hypothetical protein